MRVLTRTLSLIFSRRIASQTRPFMEEKPKEDDDMSKNDMIETIEMINVQLKENKKVVNDYAGQEMCSDSFVITICELSKALISIKQKYKETLLAVYGIYYKG